MGAQPIDPSKWYYCVDIVYIDPVGCVENPVSHGHGCIVGSILLTSLDK